MTADNIVQYRSEWDGRIADFFVRLNKDDPTIRALTVEQWNNFAARGDADDFLVVEDSAQNIIGLLTTRRITRQDIAIRHFCIYVILAERRRGLGSTLLEHVRSLDSNGEISILECRVQSTWLPGMRFLERHGFNPWLSWVGMERKRGTIQVTPVENYRLRPATIEDSPSLSDINNAAHGSEISQSPEDFVKLLERDDNEAFVIEDCVSMRVIGFCVFEPDDGGSGWIDNLAIDPPYQRRGLGRWLVESALASIQGKSPRDVSLQCDATSSPALTLYGQLGFQEIDRSTLYQEKRNVC